MANRSYRQLCAQAHALDLVGSRWTLLIVRDLLLGPWRFSDLLDRLSGITTNLLSARLREMGKNGLISRRQLPAPGRAAVYELTETGWALEPVCAALGDFGDRFLDQPAAGEKWDAGWAFLALKNRYVGAGSAAVTFQVGAQTVSVRASPARVEVKTGAGPADGVQAALAPETLRTLLRRGASARVLEDAGHLFIAGDRLQWERFLAAFALRA